MGFADILIVAAVLGLAALAVRSVWRRRGACGGCAARGTCARCCGCAHTAARDERKERCHADAP